MSETTTPSTASTSPRMTHRALRAWRHACGYSQRQLADELGVCLQAVSHWEQGPRAGRANTISTRTVRQLLALAAAKGVEPPETF